MPLMAFQHIGFEQRVVQNAGDAHTVIGKHMHVVLDVLAKFCALRIFQPGFQRGQHDIARQLLRRARIDMADGDVRGMTRFHRQRNAHQFRGHRIEAGSFGIDCGQRRGFDARQPFLQRVHRRHGFIVSLV